MNEGRLLQVGSPESIYSEPGSTFVATFIGEANLFAGQRRNALVALEAGPSFTAPGPDGKVTVVVRPEAMSIGAPAVPGWVGARGRVAERVFLGPMVRFAVRLDSGQQITVQAAGGAATSSSLGTGTEVTVGWPVGRQTVLQA